MLFTESFFLDNSIELSTKRHLQQHREDLEELSVGREFNDPEQQI